MIELVLNEYKINTKVTYMVTDNASNFAKAFRLYSTTEDEIETPENDSLIYSTDIFEILSEGEERHFRLPKQLRCASHTFNLLATNDVNKLQIKDGPYKTLSRRAFGKCNALFNKQNMSTLVADKIKNHLGRYLITPNDTRWNALYDSLSFIISHFDEVENICTDIQLPCLSKPQETDFLTEYCKVMKPIAKALDILQGEKYISIGYLLPTLTAVKKSLNQLILHGNLKYCKPLVEVLISGLKKRFDTNFESSDMKLAATLEPKFKWNWAEVEMVNELKECLKARLFELIAENTECIMNDKTNEVTYDDFLHFDALENPETDKLQNLFNEYSNSSPKLPLNTFSEEIQKLYIKYNTSIPSSAHVERLFSAGGQLFDERRGSMSDDTFEMSLLFRTTQGGSCGGRNICFSNENPPHPGHFKYFKGIQDFENI
ncbi:uncharacterized protein LOC132936189 [Metopolophium dirhodum]|uniref:uncharacterized protein LOC132936189 n=1 Tax=Metopolophium dirhodum TaxID=44670 RepID=UPI00298FEB47|nr:uncharacterized protein LOC132936189 [Metopolophium dirhodum]